MTETCFVDQNIGLSSADIQRLTNQSVGVKYLDLTDEKNDYSSIKFLLIHSFLRDDFLRQMNNCIYIGVRAHNTDYLDRETAAEMGIKVTGLRRQHGINSVAEHTLMLIMALSKNLFLSHENTVSGKWRTGLGLNLELRGKKIAIMGHGQIGKRVAELSRALGMEVLIAPKPTGTVSNDSQTERILKEADIISVHIPATKENKGFIDKRKIDWMKQDAILINTARGSVIDYKALEEALNNGKFLGVGLDVYPQEPAVKSRIFKYKNVICTPHIAYLTKESLTQMNKELIDNFLNFKSSLSGSFDDNEY